MKSVSACAIRLERSLVLAAAVVFVGGWFNPALAAFDVTNGGMEGQPNPTDNYSVAPGWVSYRDGTTRAVSWAKDTTIFHGGLAAQRVNYVSPGAGSFAGVRQTIDANVGDAITLEAWAYATSASSAQQTALGAQLDGTTARPASGTWLQTATARTTWQKLSGAVNATNTTVTVFLDTSRITNVNITAQFDDVVSFHAYVPPAPSTFAPTANSVGFDVDGGLNAANGLAEFAISIGGGAYTLGTKLGPAQTGTGWRGARMADGRDLGHGTSP